MDVPNPFPKFWLIENVPPLVERRGCVSMVRMQKRFIVREQKQIDRCHRCGGMMVREKVFELGLFDWRCVSCGDRVDPVIIAHREAHRSKSLVREEAEKLLVGHSKSHLN